MFMAGFYEDASEVKSWIDGKIILKKILKLYCVINSYCLQRGIMQRLQWVSYSQSALRQAIRIFGRFSFGNSVIDN
jgi:hypothetical protein